MMENASSFIMVVVVETITITKPWKIAETNAWPREMGGRLIKTGVFVNYQPLLVIAELLFRDGITMKHLTFVKNSSGEDVMEMIITLHRNQNVNQDVSRCQLTQIKKESEKLHLA